MLVGEGGAAAASPASGSVTYPDQADVLEIWSWINAGDLEAAAEKTLDALSRNNHADLHGLLGFIYQQSAKYDLAIPACRNAIKYGTLDWSNYLVLGSSLKFLGRNPEAYEALAEAHRLFPSRLDAALIYLEVTLDVKGMEAAREVYQSQRQLIDDPALKLKWGELINDYTPPLVPELLREGKIEEAEAMLRDAGSYGEGRRISQWLRYLARYKEWLSFTSKQRGR